MASKWLAMGSGSDSFSLSLLLLPIEEHTFHIRVGFLLSQPAVERSKYGNDTQ